LIIQMAPRSRAKEFFSKFSHNIFLSKLFIVPF
jgi:hypothetical protein